MEQQKENNSANHRNITKVICNWAKHSKKMEEITKPITNDTAEPSTNKTPDLITEAITDPSTDQTTNEILDKTTELTQDENRKQP